MVCGRAHPPFNPFHPLLQCYAINSPDWASSPSYTHPHMQKHTNVHNDTNTFMQAQRTQAQSHTNTHTILYSLPCSWDKQHHSTGSLTPSEFPFIVTNELLKPRHAFSLLVPKTKQIEKENTFFCFPLKQSSHDQHWKWIQRWLMNRLRTMVKWARLIWHGNRDTAQDSDVRG